MLSTDPRPDYETALIPRTALVLCLVAAPAVGATPFESLLKKFPAASLPFTIEKTAETKARLTSSDVETLGFMRDGSSSLSSLREWKARKKSLWPTASIQRGASVVLALRCDQGARKETYLLSYSNEGRLQGGLLFHLEEPSGVTNISSLNQAGVISRVTKNTWPMQEHGLPPELVVTAEHRAKLTSTGMLESMPPSYWTRSGVFVDRMSKEELRVFAKRVFYRSREGEAFQELEGDGNTMRSKGSPNPYIFTWDDRRSAISCQNPAGKVQVFVREQ